MCILGYHHCGKEFCEAFKCRGELHDVLCQSDYAELLVSSFDHQIKYEYYGGNMYISIYGIALEQFSTSQQPSSFLEPGNVSLHAVCHYLFLTTENSILKLQLHTLNTPLKCFKTDNLF